MEELIIKISQLSIENNQAVAGDVFIAETKKELRTKLGTVFGLIEIFNLPPEFCDKFFEIINNLQTEYYLPPFDSELGPEKRFEECLQRANRRISKIIQETSWDIKLENINALVGLMVKNKIHLSQIGQLNAFLFHRKKRYENLIIDIFGQASDKKGKINPDKMFSNIISGVISQKDDLFFSNDAVFEYLSQNQLMELINENISPIPAQQIKKILEQQGGNDNFYSIIFQTDKQAEPMVAMAPPVSAPNKVASATNRSGDGSIKKLLDTQASTEQYLMPSTIPNWKKIIIMSHRIISKAVTYLVSNLFRLLSAGLKISWRRLKGFNRKNRSANNQNNNHHQLTAADRQDNTVYTPGAKSSQKISNFINRQIAKFIRLKKFQQLLLIIAFILIFFFSQSIVWQGQLAGSSAGINIDDLVKQIEEQINSAEALNIFNDESGAKDKLRRAEELLAQIPEKKKYEQTRLDLNQKIDDLNQKLDRLIYLNDPKVVANLNDKNPTAAAVGLAKTGRLLFTFDNNNHQLYRVDLEQQQLAEFNFDLGTIQKIKPLTDQEIILLNDQGDFYRYNANDATAPVNVLSLAGLKDFDIYGGKIYTLKDNRLLKHLPVDSKFNSGSNWLKAGASTDQAQIIAIDGGIFTFNSDGSVNYFENGQSANSFTPPIKGQFSPDQAYTKADSNYLYLLDKNNNKLVVLTKQGELKIQYTSKQFSNTQAMAIDEPAKKIYLLSNNKIYEIMMDF